MRRGDGPVLVVGAGLVGLAAALALARRGVAVRVVTGEGCFEAGGPPHWLGPPAMAVLDRLGVLDALMDQGEKVERVTLSIRGAARGELALSDAGGEWPFFLRVSPDRAQGVLAGRLAAAGVAIERGTRVDHIGQTQAPAVRLSTGERLDCGAVLGCDGAASRVRALVDLPWVDAAAPGPLAVVALAGTGGTDPGEARWEVEREAGSTLRFASTDGTDWLVGLGESPERLCGRLRPGQRVARLGGGARPIGRSLRFGTGRVFLAGGAAHTDWPFGVGEGTLGVRDAAVFAGLYAAGRESEYEMRRLPQLREAFERGRRLAGRLASGQGPPHSWNGLGPRLPFLRRRAARWALGLDLDSALPAWLRDSALDDL